MSSIKKFKTTTGLKKILLCAGAALLLGLSPTRAETLDLFTPENNMNSSEWRIVNDGVMGGKSQSSISKGPNGSLIFKGNVSLKNNGGFASTRSPAIQVNLADYDGIELMVIGDGNKYKCGLRAGRQFDGIAHQSSFQTLEGKEQTLRIPFSDFDPTWRGRRLDESKRMTPDQIGTIGFLISDKQEGLFQLQVKSIRAYADDSEAALFAGSDIISVAQEAGIFNTLLAAVETAGLTETVRSLQGVTLFAPTDEAFAKISDEDLADLLKPENKKQLINILSYHVIDSEVTFSTATTLNQATALNEQELALQVKQGALFINESRVIENDISTDNGLIHVIDAVLLPPGNPTEDMQPVETIILSAIRRGVPLFNSGNPQACANLYELAAEALLTLPEDVLNPQQRALLAEALNRSKTQSSSSNRAWTMRIALDQTLEEAEK